MKLYEIIYDECKEDHVLLGHIRDEKSKYRLVSMSDAAGYATFRSAR